MTSSRVRPARDSVRSQSFESASVIIPVINETESLRHTVDQVMSATDGSIGQLIIVICEKTTAASREVCRAIKEQFKDLTLIHEQRKPFLGNAIREAFELASGSHTVMMASDLETDPQTLPHLLQKAKERPQAVVTASRWMDRSSFEGYGGGRILLNYLFQRIAQILYRTSVSDLTFGYRVFPTELVKAIRWDGQRHNFLLETILKPLRLGVEVVEVPTAWVPRREGNSQNRLTYQAEYIPTLIKCRFLRRNRIVSDTSVYSRGFV